MSGIVHDLQDLERAPTETRDQVPRPVTLFDHPSLGVSAPRSRELRTGERRRYDRPHLSDHGTLAGDGGIIEHASRQKAGGQSPKRDRMFMTRGRYSVRTGFAHFSSLTC